MFYPKDIVLFMCNMYYTTYVLFPNWKLVLEKNNQAKLGAGRTRLRHPESWANIVTHSTPEGGHRRWRWRPPSCIPRRRWYDEQTRSAGSACPEISQDRVIWKEKGRKNLPNRKVKIYPPLIIKNFCSRCFITARLAQWIDLQVVVPGLAAFCRVCKRTYDSGEISSEGNVIKTFSVIRLTFG